MILLSIELMNGIDGCFKRMKRFGIIRRDITVSDHFDRLLWSGFFSQAACAKTLRASFAAFAQEVQ